MNVQRCDGALQVLQGMLNDARAEEQAPAKQFAPAHRRTITGPDGRELSDRWAEALALRDRVAAIWSGA